MKERFEILVLWVTQLLTMLRKVGDAVPKFIELGKKFNQCDRNDIDQEIAKIFSDNDIDVMQQIRRTYTVLLSFVLKVY